MIQEQNLQKKMYEDSFANQRLQNQEQQRYFNKLKTNGVCENDKYAHDNQKYNINYCQQFKASQQNQLRKQLNLQESKFQFDESKKNSITSALVIYSQEVPKLQYQEVPKQNKNKNNYKLNLKPMNQAQSTKRNINEVDEISLDSSINQKFPQSKTEHQGLVQQITKKQEELQDLDTKINVLKRKYKYIDSIVKLSENISNLKQKPKPQEIEKNKRSNSLEFNQQTILKIDNKQRTLKMNQNLQIKIDKIIQQKDEIKSLKIQVEDLEKKFSILRNQSEEKVQKKLNLNSNMQNNDELIQKLEKEIEKNIDKNFNLQQIIQNQSNELTELKQKLDNQNQNIQIQREENQNLNQLLCNSNLEIEKHKIEIEKHKIEIQQIDQNNQNLSSENDKLNHQLNLQRQENESLTKEIQNLKQRIDGDQKQFLNELKQQNDIYDSNLHDLKQTIDELQNKIKQQDQIIISLNTMEENIRNEYLQDIQIKEQKIQELNQNIELLNTQLQEIEQQRDHLEIELELQIYQEKKISVLITNPNSNKTKVIQLKLKDSINDIYVYANLDGIYNKSPDQAQIVDKSRNKIYKRNQWPQKLYEIYTPDQYKEQVNLEITDLQ